MDEGTTLVPMSKDEAWDLTDNIRTDLETAYDAIQRAKVNIPIARERLAWEAMGYDSMEEYIEEEFGDALSALKIKVDDRMELVNVLSESGLSNRQIAGTLGVHERTVRRDLAASQARSAANAAPEEVDLDVSAGQSVEGSGHIDADECRTEMDIEPDPYVTQEIQEEPEYDEKHEEERKQRLDDWLSNISFDNMIISSPQQIIEAEPSGDTEEYFVPRPEPARPLEPVNPKLPPPRSKAYDDQLREPVEAIEEPTTTPKSPDPYEKHCKTCACNLLP